MYIKKSIVNHMFQDIFGESPQTKILDFLSDHPEYDYSISEIAKHAQVSRPTVYKIIDILLDKKLLIQTREQGNSALYKLNLDNKLVQVILKFDFELAKKIADTETPATLKKQMKITLKSPQKNSRHKTVIPS